ncbi:MAG: RidA family protein [Caulobacteraceae bacterium]
MKAALVLAPLLVASPISTAAPRTAPVFLASPLAKAQNLPFSSGVVVGRTLYIAGTTGVDPGEANRPDPSQEARIVMNRVEQTVKMAGMTMDDVVEVQVFCTDLSDYVPFNAVYGTYFHGHYPARAFIGVAGLTFGARYEVMGIAVRRR